MTTTVHEAKREIMQRLRTALDAPRPNPVTTGDDVPRSYMRADSKAETGTPRAKALEVLQARLADAGARVATTTDDALSADLAALMGPGRFVIARGLPPEWTAAAQATAHPAAGSEATSAVEILTDSPDLNARALDSVDAAITGAHTAAAITGTIALNAADPRCGRRIISLIPDRHIIVLHHEDVVVTVPALVARMQDAPTAPWTWITGPSATSDIELNRVEGVHGPRTLDVLLVLPTAPAHEASDPSEGASA